MPGGSQAAPLPGLKMAAFSLFPHRARNVSSLVSLLIRILLRDEGPTLMTHLTSITSVEAPPPKITMPGVRDSTLSF